MSEENNSMARIMQNRRVVLFSLWFFNQSKERKKSSQMFNKKAYSKMQHLKCLAKF